MIAKKNSKQDLESKRSAFFTLGLLVTGSLTLAAFTYSDPMLKADPGNDVVRTALNITYEPEIKMEEKKEVTDQSDQADDSDQKQMIDISEPIGMLIKKTPNTGEVKTGVTVQTGGMPTGPKITRGGTKTKMTAPIEDWVDAEAEYVGGFIEMQRYIQNEMEYPAISIAANEEGTVYMSFVVETDGDISNIKVERGVSRELDREAKRVVKSFPKWIPGEKNAVKVRTRVRLPIVFKLK